MKAGFKGIIDKVEIACFCMLTTEVSPKQLQIPNLIMEIEKQKVPGEEWRQQGRKLKCQAAGLDVFNI